MTGLDEMIVGLFGELAAVTDANGAGGALTVTSVDLQVPLEARIGPAGLSACVPRGRRATGFDVPLGRAFVRVQVTGT